jgi:hypothetical protein
MSDLSDITRKLVAVFAADVEGYSRLMGADEVGTLRGLRSELARSGCGGCRQPMSASSFRCKQRFGRFRKEADIKRQVGPASSVANDPQQTSRLEGRLSLPCDPASAT